MSERVEEINELGGFVTIAQAARVSGLSAKQVRHLAAHQRIKAVRLGGWLVMVEKRGLRRYVHTIEQREQRANQPAVSPVG